MTRHTEEHSTSLFLSRELALRSADPNTVRALRQGCEQYWRRPKMPLRPGRDTNPGHHLWAPTQGETMELESVISQPAQGSCIDAVRVVNSLSAFQNGMSAHGAFFFILCPPQSHGLCSKVDLCKLAVWCCCLKRHSFDLQM